MQGNLERVCNPCILNGAGAFELLPALHHLRQELCSFNESSSDFAALPPAKQPSQAVAECVAAVGPLREARRRTPLVSDQGEKLSGPELLLASKGFQASVEAEVGVAQRERRARALADVAVGAQMTLSKELAQERKNRQELEGRLGELLEGMCQLDKMLKNVPTEAEAKADIQSDDAASDEASNSGRSKKSDEAELDAKTPTQQLKEIQRVLASCTLSAGVRLHRRKNLRPSLALDGSGRPVPVLSRLLCASTASTIEPASSPSESYHSDSPRSSDSESGGSSAREQDDVRGKDELDPSQSPLGQDDNGECWQGLDIKPASVGSDTCISY